MAETEATAAEALDSTSLAESSFNPNPETPQILSAEQKFEIVRSIGEECIHEDELRKLLAEKQEPIAYDGFEPSGRMHIAQADICQLGMDQPKVNVLAREYCDVIKQGQEKMSKSDSELSIFLDDEEVEVNDKIKEAYCPPKVVEGNPCIEYIKYLVLPKFNGFTVERGEDNGGNKTFKNFEELVADYESGELHPDDLKPALSKSLNKMLEPVRENFRKDPIAKELQERVKEYIKESTKN